MAYALVQRVLYFWAFKMQFEPKELSINEAKCLCRPLSLLNYLGELWCNRADAFHHFCFGSTLELYGFVYGVDETLTNEWLRNRIMRSCLASLT